MVGSKRKIYKKTKSASLKSVNVKLPLNITLRVGYSQINVRIANVNDIFWKPMFQSHNDNYTCKILY